MEVASIVVLLVRTVVAVQVEQMVYPAAQDLKGEMVGQVLVPGHTTVLVVEVVLVEMGVMVLQC